MVATLLEERFDARGRVLRLVNHATTSAGTALGDAAQPAARRAGDGRAHGPRAGRAGDLHDLPRRQRLQAGRRALAAHPCPGSRRKELREALDAAGIRHRVIAISACYSGGWIEPLATEDSLVMTAADAEHTSYGCGHRSELTFFGRAVFDEALRKTPFVRGGLRGGGAGDPAARDRGRQGRRFLEPADPRRGAGSGRCWTGLYAAARDEELEAEERAREAQ